MLFNTGSNLAGKLLEVAAILCIYVFKCQQLVEWDQLEAMNLRRTATDSAVRLSSTQHFSISLSQQFGVKAGSCFSCFSPLSASFPASTGSCL